MSVPSIASVAAGVDAVPAGFQTTDALAPARGEFAPWPSAGLTVLGQSGGAVAAEVAFERRRPIAWRGVGSRVVAIDLSRDPPVTLGRSEMLGDPVTRVSAADGWVVAARDLNSRTPEVLWLLDGRDPAWPRLVGEITLSGWLSGGWAIREDTLAVGMGAEVLFYDLTDPAQPLMVRRLTWFDGAIISALYFDGPLLYVVWGRELVTFDTRDLRKIRTESALMLPKPFDSAATYTTASNGRLMAAMESFRSVHLLRLVGDGGGSGRPTGEGLPRLEASLTSLLTHRPLVLGPAHLNAMVTDSDTGLLSLRRLDVSRPDQPRSLPDETTDLPGEGVLARLAAAGSYVGVSLQGRGLWTWSVQGDGSLWPRVPWRPVAGSPLDVVAGDGSLISISSSGLLQHLDVSRPNQPRVLAFAELVAPTELVRSQRAGSAGTRIALAARPSTPPLQPLALARGGRGLWMTTNHGHLLALPVDVTGPIDPAEHGVALGMAPSDLWADEDLAVTTDGNRIIVHDLDPGGLPRLLGSLAWPGDGGTGNDLVVHEGFAWLGGSNGLRVVDLRDPANPRSVYRLPMPPILALTISGPRAYVVSDTSGAVDLKLSILDIAQPTAPRVLGELDLPPAARARIAVEDGRVAVALSGQGVRLVDVRLAAFPDELGWMSLPCEPIDLLFEQGMLWLVDGRAGLVALGYGPRPHVRLALPWLAGGLW